MRLINMSMNSLLQHTINKKLVVFPAGSQFKQMMSLERHTELKDRLAFIADSNESLAGSKIAVRVAQDDIRSYEVRHIRELCAMNPNDITILVTHIFFPKLIKQLDQFPELEDVECCVYQIMHAFDRQNTNITYGKEQYIPKIIHYCWFGSNPLPELTMRCIKSWENHCPDYEIIRWDESNYDISHDQYTRDAYKLGGWAYISNYARMKILHEHGGIYLDTDVELLRNLDPLLTFQGFIGYQAKYGFPDEGRGFGVVPKSSIVSEVLELYRYADYLTDADRYAPIWRVLMSRGLELSGRFQLVDGIAVFPQEYFDPIDYWGLDATTSESYSIHHEMLSGDDVYERNSWRQHLKDSRCDIRRSVDDILKRMGIGRDGKNKANDERNIL